MKDLIRLKTSLSQEVEAILNEQVKIEALSSAKYLAMASWCGEKGFKNSEDFFMKQAEEERAHMLKIFRFIGDAGGKAYSPEVNNITHEYSSLRDIFETALEQEIGVSHAIHRIVNICRKVNDYTTEHFMQWFIKEQLEEEFIARRQVELFDVIGESGQGLYLIDQAITKVVYDGAMLTIDSAAGTE
jgi:ferritin